MKRPSIFFILVLLLVPSVSQADWFHTLVRFECQPDHNLLIVSYRGAYNEEGEAMVSSKSENEWEPGALVEIRDDERTEIIDVREVKNNCKLSDGLYTVTIRPVPGNYNMQGRCGAHISAGVRIENGVKNIIDTDFEGDCHESDPVITTVTVSPRLKARVTKVEKNEFYK